MSVRDTHDSESARGRTTFKTTLDHSLKGKQGTGWNLVLAGTDSDGEKGVYSEGGFSFVRSNVKSLLALGVFHIPSYDARYYRYEPDVPGRGMTRPVWGDGSAIIILIRAPYFALRYRYLTSNQSLSGHELTLQSDLVF
jgi:hypothetical protein